MGCLVMPEPPLQAQAQLPVATTGRDPPSLPQVLSPNPSLVTELLVFWLSPLMLPKPRDRERPKPFPLLQQPERPSSTRRSTTSLMITHLMMTEMMTGRTMTGTTMTTRMMTGRTEEASSSTTMTRRSSPPPPPSRDPNLTLLDTRPPPPLAPSLMCLVMPEPPLQAQAQLPVATTGRDPPSLPQVLSLNPSLVTELLVFWLSPLMLPKPRDRERPKPFPLLQQLERPSSTRR